MWLPRNSDSRRSSRRLVVLSLAVVLAAACGDRQEVDDPAAASSEASDETQGLRPPDPLYGPDGELLASSTVIAGLAMPRGLELLFEEERSHVYETRVPLLKVQRYFGPRLMTGQVDRMGDGAVFREALPAGVAGATVKLDVSILPVPNGVRVEVTELRVPPANPPSEAEIRQQAEEDMRRWD